MLGHRAERLRHDDPVLRPDDRPGRDVLPRGRPEGSTTAANEAGRWVAAISPWSSADRPFAKLSATTLGRRYVSGTSGGAPGRDELEDGRRVRARGREDRRLARERGDGLALVRDERIDVDERLDVRRPVSRRW